MQLDREQAILGFDIFLPIAKMRIWSQKHPKTLPETAAHGFSDLVLGHAQWFHAALAFALIMATQQTLKMQNDLADFGSFQLPAWNMGFQHWAI